MRVMVGDMTGAFESVASSVSVVGFRSGEERNRGRKKGVGKWCLACSVAGVWVVCGIKVVAARDTGSVGQNGAVVAERMLVR